MREEDQQLGVIRIHNLRFHTFNGVLPEERRNGQQLAIDVALTYPIEARVQHDALNETISYADVRDTIDKFVNTHSYKLIESLANELLKKILGDYTMTTHVNLKIRKYSVPMPGIFDDVEIEVAGDQVVENQVLGSPASGDEK